MANKSLVCKNDKCRGTNFEQVSGNTWKCVDCGTLMNLSTKKVTTKQRIKKEKVTVKDYQAMVFKCEHCGEIIGTLHHPREEKQLNEDWAKHICSSQNKFIQ